MPAEREGRPRSQKEMNEALDLFLGYLWRNGTTNRSPMYEDSGLSRPRVDRLAASCTRLGLVEKERREKGHQTDFYSLTADGQAAYILQHALTSIAPVGSSTDREPVRVDTGDEELMHALDVLRRKFVGSSYCGARWDGIHGEERESDLRDESDAGEDW